MPKTPPPVAVPPSNRYRRRRFATEYAAVPNGAQAAIKAGYSPKSAHVTASRLLRHPEVVAVIAQERAAAAEEIGLHGRATLEHARATAVLSLANYWVFEPLPRRLPSDPSRSALRLKRWDELTAAERYALSPDSFDEDGDLVQIVLQEALPAVLELGRRAGLPGFDEEASSAP